MQYSRSIDFNKLLEDYGVTPLYNVLYTPHQNPNEHVNHVLKTVLSYYVQENHKTWSKNLAQIACALRTARYTPFFSVFGREMVLKGKDYKNFKLREQVSGMPDLKTVDERVAIKSEDLKNLQQEIRKKLKKVYEVTKKRNDLRKRSVSVKVGDLV